MLSREVTAIIPVHQPRINNGMLTRALASVTAQTWGLGGISVAIDYDRQGAPATRQRALDAVRTGWTACLDSDDEWLPEHVEKLYLHAEAEQADYVYSWFYGTDGFDPFPQHFGQPFDPLAPIETTSTILVRTELAMEARYERLPERLNNTGEDWRFLTRCIELGAKIVHLPERTWRWNIHPGGNTSGLPDRGDAAP